MQYLRSFLEGIITFVSPALLPMLPIYLAYFAGGRGGNRKKALRKASGFILGLVIVCLTPGVLAGLLRDYTLFVNIITGAVVIFFGIQFLGVLRFSFLDMSFTGNLGVKDLGFVSSMVLGVAFSISWTSGVVVFPGLQQAPLLTLLCYSLGLGIPFLLSALLIDWLKNTFDFLKKHYGMITKASGVLMIAMGVLMMTGIMGRFLALLSA